jgi:hypothetical protein
MAQENISAQLNDLLISRDFDPDMLDYQGKPSTPEDATVFSFDYESSTGKNYGTMVVVLDDENDMQVFYGDNLGRSMDPEDKTEFFDFIQHLHKFANMRRWTFSPKDITRVKHTMQGLAAIKEGLFEGYYGTRKISYSGEPTEARLVIKHNRALGESDARFRYVESLFIETAEGERFRLPFKNLAGGRAMLEHVRQGGKPYDIRGSHIAEMVTELATLSRFNRASRTRVLEGATAELVSSAQGYYKQLQESLKRLSSSRGYNTYFEAWHPANVGEQEELVENIKTLFVEQTIDTRIEQALPLLAKIQKESSMKEVEIFENWVDQLSEGTWALPETPEQIQRLKDLMSTELTVGPDATNATELLYDLVGDDELFDQLQAIAQDNPDADVRDVVQQRLQQLGVDLDNEPGVGFSDETGAADDEELDEDAVADFLARGGQIQTGRFHKPRKSEKTDYGSRHIGGVRDAVAGKAGKTLGKAAATNFKGGGKAVVGEQDGEILHPETLELIDEYIAKIEPDADRDEMIQSVLNNYIHPSELEYALQDVSESSACNHTMEGEMCPEHGLAECGMHEAYNPYDATDQPDIDPDSFRDHEPSRRGSSPPLQRSPEQEREFEKMMRYLNRDRPVREGNDDPMNYNAAITGSYYESKEDPLARLKTLASIKKS